MGWDGSIMAVPSDVGQENSSLFRIFLHDELIPSPSYGTIPHLTHAMAISKPATRWESLPTTSSLPVWHALHKFPPSWHRRSPKRCRRTPDTTVMGMRRGSCE